MLERLFVRNFALVGSLEIELGGGLVLLTGETGAGKSLLIGALSSLLGGRVDASLVLSKGEEALVEGTLTGLDPGASGLLKNLGITPEEKLILRRKLDKKGKNSAFANGSALTLGQLRSLIAGSLEINGQHQGAKLLDEDNHLKLLDSLPEIAPLSLRVASSALELKKLGSRLKLARGRSLGLRNRMEELRTEIAEIDRVGPRENEDEELKRRKKTLENSSRIMEDLGAIVSAVSSGEPSVLSLMKEVLKRTEDLSRFDGDWKVMLKEMENARETIMEAGRASESRMSSMEFSPDELDNIQERQYQLEKLQRKYGPALDDVLARRDAAARELGELEGPGFDEDKLQKRLEDDFGRWLELAQKLSGMRKAGAKEFSVKVLGALRPLALEKARFEVALEPLRVDAPEDVTEKGLEEARFLFSANDGEQMMPLARIASGGELSRTMLAILCSLGSGRSGSTTVFDEVDAGIGGKPAEMVGAYLHELSRNGQVICVTHLPQIASFADQHIKVEKVSEGGKTSVNAKTLSEGERTAEIARMLAGEKVTESALAHAGELIRMASEKKAKKA